MTRIACVACMDANKSVHTLTWLRAIELAQEFLLPPQVTLELFDDNADARRAAETARQIVAWSPDAIVGHFASAAAQAAAPVYALHHLPLFLPAATAKHLTSFATTWRLCDNDEDYVCWLVELLTSEGQKTVFIDHDGSVHGESVTQQLSAALTPSGCAPPPSTAFFAGSFSHTLEWTVNWARRSPESSRLILADDAFSAQLVPALLASGIDPGSRQIYVAAIAPQPTGELARKLASVWHQRWGGTPGCYFWETLAALQVACRYPDFPTHTLLGTLRFDAQRESSPASFSLWQATRNGLHRVLATEKIL